MSKRLRLPAKLIAYVMESFAPMIHGHYMNRLPPINELVGGNKYDAFPNPSENAITIVVAYADSERNLYSERLRNAREQHSKAHVKLAERKGALLEATEGAERLSGPRKVRAEGARDQFTEQVALAEREVERLASIIADSEAFLEDWQQQEVISVTAAEWNQNTYVLSVDDVAPELPLETPLEAVKRRIKDNG